LAKATQLALTLAVSLPLNRENTQLSKAVCFPKFLTALEKASKMWVVLMLTATEMVGSLEQL